MNSNGRNIWKEARLLWHEKNPESSEGVSEKDTEKSLADLMEDVELSRSEKRQKRREERREKRQENRLNRREKRQENRLEQKEERQEARQERREARQEARHKRIMNRIGSRKSRAEYGWDNQGNRLNKKERQAAFNEYFDLLAKYGLQSFMESNKKAGAPQETVNYASSNYSFDTPVPSTNTEKGSDKKELSDIIPKDTEKMRKAAANMIPQANIDELAIIGPKVVDISPNVLDRPDFLAKRRKDIQIALLNQDISPKKIEEVYNTLQGNAEKRKDHSKRMQWAHDRLDQLTSEQLLDVGKIADPITPEKTLKKMNEDGDLLRWLQGKDGLVKDAPYFSFQISEDIKEYIKDNLGEKGSQAKEKAQVAQAKPQQAADEKPQEVATETDPLDEIPDLDAFGLEEAEAKTGNESRPTSVETPEIESESAPEPAGDAAENSRTESGDEIDNSEPPNFTAMPEEEPIQSIPDEAPSEESNETNSKPETKPEEKEESFTEGFLNGF